MSGQACRVRMGIVCSFVAGLVAVVGLQCGQAQPAAGPTTTRATSGPATAAAVRRVHVFVSGRVQGVGFRNFTQLTAIKVGATGWVRNLKDGRVEAVIEGAPDQVAKMLEAVKRGPSSASVDKVDLTDEKPTAEFKKFTTLPNA